MGLKTTKIISYYSQTGGRTNQTQSLDIKLKCKSHVCKMTPIFCTTSVACNFHSIPDYISIFHHYFCLALFFIAMVADQKS